MDITYIPMAHGFVYLAVVLDWFSRRVLSWRVSITMDAAFCVETLEDALARHGKPDIFNTDQGSQFTGAAFTGVLTEDGIAISMDGKGACPSLSAFVARSVTRGSRLAAAMPSHAALRAGKKRIAGVTHPRAPPRSGRQDQARPKRPLPARTHAAALAGTKAARRFSRSTK
jgi:hypothetical protein